MTQEIPHFKSYYDKDLGRKICAPNETMRAIHADFMGKIVADVEIDLPHATGSMPGSSPALNVVQHRRNRHFYLLDLAEAYTQVDTDVLAEKLVERGFDASAPELAVFILRYCVDAQGQGLAMGGPASPLLFNIYCADMDTDLGFFSREAGITYTRYMDDLTFSRPDEGFQLRDVIGKKDRWQIKQLVSHHGFELSDRKTRVLDSHKNPVMINGIQLNKDGSYSLSKNYLRRLPQMLDDLLVGLEPFEALHQLAGYKGHVVSAFDYRRNDGLQSPDYNSAIKYLNRRMKELKTLLSD